MVQSLLSKTRTDEDDKLVESFSQPVVSQNDFNALEAKLEVNEDKKKMVSSFLVSSFSSYVKTPSRFCKPGLQAKPWKVDLFDLPPSP